MRTFILFDDSMNQQLPEESSDKKKSPFVRETLYRRLHHHQQHFPSHQQHHQEHESLYVHACRRHQQLTLRKMKTEGTTLRFSTPFSLSLFFVTFLMTTLLSITVRGSQYVSPGECSWTHLSDGHHHHTSSSATSSRDHQRESNFQVNLRCRVRTINPRGLNFSLIQPEHTVQLTVTCDDNMLESRFENGSLSHLRYLKSLSIFNCKLLSLTEASLKGLQLRNLTIRRIAMLGDQVHHLQQQNPSHASFWESSSSLTLSPQGLMVSSLSSQRQTLEFLDLGFNSMSKLPDDLFCPLTNLKILNLTHNRLTGFSSLGLVDPSTGHLCLQELKTLDLSHNKIRFLSETGVASLKNLQALYLHHNQINSLAELSLSALSRLTTIDLSNNALSVIPSRLFRDSTELKELYLHNNSIFQLPSELFKGLTKLQVLNLSHNEIGHEHLTRETFLDLIRVVVLDLSHNRLKKLNGSIFESQYSLQILDLQDNDIIEIMPNAFSSLYNLDTLILTSNSLKAVEAQTLNGLFVLKRLSLDENELSRVHQAAFTNCSSLHELSLNGNLLSEVPKAVSTLKQLRILGMRDNAITDMRHAPFLGLQHLSRLDLSRNKIVNVTRGSLADLPSLQILDLSSNHLKSCDHGVFDDAPDLQFIFLQNNLLTDINGLFMNLPALRVLNVSRNKIGWFDYALIPKELTHLDLHYNRVEEIGNYFDLSASLALKWMDISFNHLKHLAVSSIPNRIEVLNASSNLMTFVHHFSFKNKGNLRKVDLRNNSLTHLDSNSLQLDPPSGTPTPDSQPQFFISNNPYSCDCNMEWLQGMSGEVDPSSPSPISSGRYPKLLDLKDVQCRMPTSRDNSTVPLLQVNPSNFLCRYKTHCFALCHCCDFDACDCEMMCPENCTCFYDSTWNTNIVDCSATGYQDVPTKIPMDVTELYLDSNNIHSLSNHAFIGRKNLKVLYLNNSDIHVINNRTFNGLKNLQVLDLKSNHLTTLFGYEFERLFDLKELYLSYNKISTIANNTFAAMRSLKILHLDHNYIVEFSVWSLSINSRLQDVTLSHNSWSCECRFLKQYTAWLNEKQEIVRDSFNIQCFYNDSISLRLLASDFNVSSCSTYSSPPGKVVIQPQIPELAYSHVPQLIPLAVVIGSCSCLILISIIILVVYRQKISVWLYLRYGVRLNLRAAATREEEKLFDCFISYSKKDEAFVAQILAAELEYGNPPFRVCLHYRDLPLATGYLSDAIVEAMEASRRSILVISENFLKGEWCRYEFKSAHLEVLRTNHRHKLILIFIGEINGKDFDPDIRYWLKTSTVLQWGEKMFWEKLRYAMPDVSVARKPYLEQTRDMTVAVHI